MQLKYKILIGVAVIAAVLVTLIFIGPSQNVITVAIVIISIIITFLGLAIYEEQLEKREELQK